MLKRIDPYAAFLWIVLGIPGISLVVLILGGLSLMMWRDEGWSIIPMMIFFVTPIMTFIFGNMGNQQIESAKEFCMGWLAMILFVIVAFVVPAFIMLGLKYIGAIDALKGLLA